MLFNVCPAVQNRPDSPQNLFRFRVVCCKLLFRSHFGSNRSMQAASAAAPALQWQLGPRLLGEW